MSFGRFCLALSLLTSFLQAQTGKAQISKGNQILINRGLQIQGMVNTADIFHLSTYTNANYTSINWFYNSDTSQMGAAPGFPWGRWVDSISSMPPLGSESSYMSQLVSLSLSDEPYLDSNSYFTNMVHWFTNVQSSYPNTILYINNWGGEVSDGALGNFIAQAKPDLISFDTYPWQCVHDYNASNHIGATIGGPPTGWYSELRRYRQFGMGYNIPFGIYRQTFHAVQDYNTTVYRNPSGSELRLNTFAALAFNAKMLIDFTYNTGASSLFERYYYPDGSSTGAGDLYPNALYTEQSDINLRARNLGKALVLLKPIYDLHNPNDVNPPPGPASTDPSFQDGYTTSLMFLRGKYLSGGATNFTPVPNSLLNDPSSSANPSSPNSIAYTWWEFPKNDPYLNGWSVTNKAGIKNDGLPGDVIVSWFTPLDESFDGTNYSNQIYMMVVNSLIDTNGTPADCLQEIKFTFSGLSGSLTNLIMLDSLTGQLQTNGLPSLPPPNNAKRQLTLNLNGGDAVLFKFNTGAPFVGFYPIPARMGLQKQGGTTTVSIQGTAATRYRLETTPSLPSTNWTVLTNLLLPSSTYLFQDTTSSNASNGFYRAVGTP
jgi:hypothetical protein